MTGPGTLRQGPAVLKHLHTLKKPPSSVSSANPTIPDLLDLGDCPVEKRTFRKLAFRKRDSLACYLPDVEHTHDSVLACNGGLS